MWTFCIFKLLQNVRLLYRNSDGGGELSVAFGVRFVLARIVQERPKIFCFAPSFMVPELVLHFIQAWK